MINACLTWFQMGGYAKYVWPAYLSVFMLFLGYFLHAKIQKKRIIRQIIRLYGRR